MSWINTKSQVVHAHGMMVNRQSNWTACQRARLWGSNADGALREDFVYFDGLDSWPQARLCQRCVDLVQNQVDWLQRWIDECGL